MISFAIKKRCWIFVGTMIAFAGCDCLKDEVHELTSGQFPDRIRLSSPMNNRLSTCSNAS